MRFAWLRKQLVGTSPRIQTFPHPAFLSRFAYNLVFWVVVLPFVSGMSYATGFVAFAVVLLIRAAVNAHHNNRMPQPPEAFERHPLRIPL